MSYTKCQEADEKTDGYLEGKREYEAENFRGIESDSYGTALGENQRERQSFVVALFQLISAEDVTGRECQDRARGAGGREG